MRRLKTHRIGFFVIGVSVLFSSGCRSSEIVMDAELATEIAMDMTGYKAGEVLNLTVSENDDQFLVKFKSTKGIYKLVIDAAGSVVSYEHIKTDEMPYFEE